jgi:hypothetical protein
MLEHIVPLLVLIITEIPAFVVTMKGGASLCSVVGMKRYQIIVASLVVMTSISQTSELILAASVLQCALHSHTQLFAPCVSVLTNCSEG